MTMGERNDKLTRRRRASGTCTWLLFGVPLRAFGPGVAWIVDRHLP
jgi:hypothetical protein